LYRDKPFKHFWESDIVKKVQRNLFKVSPVAAAIALVLVAPFVGQVALAGSGFGAGVNTLNQPVAVPTYYANSPAGAVPKLDAAGARNVSPVTGLPEMVSTGAALRKFVDKLPGIPGLTPATVGGAAFGANGLGQYIPLAKAEKWMDPNGVTSADDYYEIAAVEFSEKMHSDLPKATHLRGYVQLSTATNPGKHIQLFYPAVAPATVGQPILDAAGAFVYAYDNPHHLGPIITSTKGTAVRVKFTNYLPVGTGGELFIPVDTTLTGAGKGPDGDTPYTQNRAEIHLVGGQSPWISAGTPHQWVAPVGEITTLARGASAQNVPDMLDPGAGSTTLYFPNDMSARFTFMQDRTSGLTRLNSYAGLEAGYLVTDAAEQILISGGTFPATSTSPALTVAAGTIPADQIPLIIEDKTFVPANVSQQDALWDTTHWGQPGDLWFPHVYETNQDVSSIDGTNPVGRWDYGPLFWPIFPAKDALPTGKYSDASFTPEAFHDTPVINGTAYPTLTVDPKAYRLRILNASNDRYINLGLYRADPTTRIAPQLDANGNPIVNADGGQMYFTNTEVKMVPATGDAAGNPVGWDAVAGVQLPLPKYPTLKTNINAEPSGPARAWPVDNRIGGAPDPTLAGPDFIVIGNDGGLLPNPVDVPAQPITYEANRRSITVGNIYGYGLLLGPAERSDAIVDFSAYAGKTLILYNDAPAPAPFNDVRDDYFTGGPDQTGSGGSYSTKPGYGPNTRTMMQIVVRNTNPAAAFDPAPLLTGLPAAYALSQPAPIVPAAAYNAAFGTNDTDIFAHVATGSAAQPTLDFSSGAITITGLTLVTSGGQVGGAGNSIPGSGTGYDPSSPPTVVINNTVNGVPCLPTGVTPATAKATVNPTTRQVTAVTLDMPYVPANVLLDGTVVPASGGYSGYVCAPTVTFTNPPGTSGVGAQVTVQSTNMSKLNVFTKAEQELFDNRGRYNATGGVELPLTNGIVQTTVPLNYMDSATETIKDGEVQVWKLVDNGLWTNSMHFNMVDVQLINRVGWDGTVKAPSSNEVGWKDTLRLNPLEDVIVAMRAKRPQVPFGQPKSSRVLDPSKPEGTGNAPAVPAGVTQYASGLGFTVVTGLGTPISPTNVLADFDNEFAWGSAILSHAENDLTRPIVYQPTVELPAAPSGLALSANGTAVTWVDPTPAGQVATLANVQNEIGFTVQRASYAVDMVTVGAYSLVGAVPANATSFTDPALLVPNTKYSYIVSAWNTKGSTASGASDLTVVFPPPTGLLATPVATVDSITGVYPDQVNLSWADHSNGAATYQVWRGGLVIATLAVGSTTYTDSTVLDGTAYSYQVVGSLNGNTASSNTVAVTTPGIAIKAPTLVTATAGTYSAVTNKVPVTVRWTDNATNETAYLVEESANGGSTWTPAFTVARTGAAITGGGAVVAPAWSVAPNMVYNYRVTAQNKPSDSATVSALAVVDLTAPQAPMAASGLTATLNSSTRVALAWTDNASTENSYLVTIVSTPTAGGASTTTTATVNRTAAQSTLTGGLVTYNATVVQGNSYSFTVVAQATRFGQTTPSAATAPATMVVGVPAVPTIGTATQDAVGSIIVNWTDNSSNESGFTVQRSMLNTAGTNWGAMGTAGAVAANVTTFTDTARQTGRTYRYQVRANGVVGNSAYVGPSNQVVAP
jgi:FtsP/CotA-like multicopper oxidase with cupredoxin domain